MLAPSTRFRYFMYQAAMVLWLLVAQAGRKAAAAPEPASRTCSSQARSAKSRCHAAYHRANHGSVPASGTMWVTVCAK